MNGYVFVYKIIELIMKKKKHYSIKLIILHTRLAVERSAFAADFAAYSHRKSTNSKPKQ